MNELAGDKMRERVRERVCETLQQNDEKEEFLEGKYLKEESEPLGVPTNVP
jgi:hypothetical protein